MKTTILTTEPVVTCIAEMMLVPHGLEDMAEWVRSRAPECVPDEYDDLGPGHRWRALFPHPMREAVSRTGISGVAEAAMDESRVLSPNELLVELAGRKCYNSFGNKAGRKSNREYIANTQAGDIPHASIMYHAKMSFFIAGVSRRVSHELIRHYVGADRTEEGSPSQESTRYVEHPGFYMAHPAILDKPEELDCFRSAMSRNYAEYRDYITRRSSDFERAHGAPPKGMDRKRIFESASPYLSHSCETSFIWTSNPIALAKMFKERDNEAADLEYLRFARKWKAVCLERWPNLFPQWTQAAGAEK